MLLTEGYDPAPVNLSEFKDVFYPITPTKFYIEYQKNDGLQNVSPFKNYGVIFSASIQLGATKNSHLCCNPLLGILVDPRIANAEAHVSWCIQRDQRKIAGAKGRFFFFRAGGGMGGQKQPNKKYIVLNGHGKAA